MPELLYVDTSALLDRALGQKRHHEIAAAMRDHARRDGRLVSSRLMRLEARRIEVRESLAGRDITPLGVLTEQINSLPLTDEVWRAAYDIRFHARALDAIHLATCVLIDAVLLSSDRGMIAAAQALGIVIHPAGRADN